MGSHFIYPRSALLCPHPSISRVVYVDPSFKPSCVPLSLVFSPPFQLLLPPRSRRETHAKTWRIDQIRVWEYKPPSRFQTLLPKYAPASQLLAPTQTPSHFLSSQNLVHRGIFDPAYTGPLPSPRHSKFVHLFLHLLIHMDSASLSVAHSCARLSLSSFLSYPSSRPGGRWCMCVSLSRILYTPLHSFQTPPAV